jgi:hypothetical protein
MRIFFCLALLFFGSHFLLSAQSQPKETIKATLSREVDETSGLVLLKNGRLISINDGGSLPRLYFLDSISGKIVHRQDVLNATNVDWEELTLDQDGNVFIGDFGNNFNWRKDLCIYKIKASDLGKKTAVAEKIEFHYSNQNSFPPNPRKWNFDMEAMVHVKGKLYLFSKNRCRPFTGYTYVYELEDQAGSHTADLIDSLLLGDSWREEFWISGASYSASEKKLMLLSYHAGFLFENWEGGKISKSEMKFYRTANLRQREAIVFDGSRYLISEEGAVQYRSHLLEWRLDEDTLLLVNQDFEKELRIRGYSAEGGLFAYEIFNQIGKRIAFSQEKEMVQGRFMRRIDIGSLPYGPYVLSVQCGEFKRAFRFEKKRNQSKLIDKPAPEGIK